MLHQFNCSRRDICIVKSHGGKSKAESSSSKSKSSDSEIVKSKSTGRKFKSSASPQVSLSWL